MQSDARRSIDAVNLPKDGQNKVAMAFYITASPSIFQRERMPQVKITDRERDTLPGAIASLGADTGTDLTLVCRLVQTILHMSINVCLNTCTCRDGAVQSYQALFAWSSTSLRQLFLSQLLRENGGERKEEVTLMLPDLGITSVSVLASFLLTGEIKIRASWELRSELEVAWQLLTVDRIKFRAALVGGGGGGGGRRGARQSIVRQQPVQGGKVLNLSSGVVITPPLAASTPARPLGSLTRIPSTLVNNANVSVIREHSEKEVEVIDVTGPPGPEQIVFKPSVVPQPSENKHVSAPRPEVARGPLRTRLAPKAGVHKRRPLTVPITTEAGRLLPGVTATSLKNRSKENTDNVSKDAPGAQKKVEQAPSAIKVRGRPRKNQQNIQEVKAPLRRTVPVVVAKAKAKDIVTEVVGVQRKSQRNKLALGSLNEEVLEQKSLAKANAKRDKENLVKNVRSLEEEQVDEPTNDNIEAEDDGVELGIASPLAVAPLGFEDQLSCYICKQDKDEEGRSLNQKNMFFVRNHLSKCLYATGKLFSSVPPGASNMNEEGAPLDETGSEGHFYHCQVKDCWLAEKTGEAGRLCYKVYAIHMASQHGALEMVMLDEGPEARYM